MSFGFFSLEDFKKWVDESEDKSPRLNQSNKIGLAVESKVSTSRLIEVICDSEHDVVDIAKDFRENGGVIVEVEGQQFKINTAVGAFTIPRQFVTKA